MEKDKTTIKLLRRILIFDDDYESMLPVKDYLEQTMGWIVELTAEEDILFRLKHEKFDVVCVDIMILPKSLNNREEEVKNVHFDEIHWQNTGLEFIRRFRESSYYDETENGTPSNVPIIIISAIADPLLTEGQIMRYIEKPFIFENLIKAIRDAVG